MMSGGKGCRCQCVQVVGCACRGCECRMRYFGVPVVYVVNVESVSCGCGMCELGEWDVCRGCYIPV